MEINLFDKKELLSFVKNKKNIDNKSLLSLLIQISEDSNIRTLTKINRNYLTKIKELHERFPNFKEVIDFIDERLSLNYSTVDKIFYLPPILLKGDPGVGKTYFCEELSKLFNLYFTERDLSITSEAFVLSGMDSSWGNSKNGLIFDTLFNNKTANPIICLNEIDKVNKDRNNNSPVNILYTLLEQNSAKNFKDEFVPIKLRADNIIWFLTANDGYIPDAILSRLEVFIIKNPSKEENIKIIKSIFKDLYETQLKHTKVKNILTDNVINHLLNINSRIVKKIILQSASICIKNKRYTIEEMDVLKSLLRYDKKEVKNFGFK